MREALRIRLSIPSTFVTGCSLPGPIPDAGARAVNKTFPWEEADTIQTREALISTGTEYPGGVKMSLGE